MLTCPDLFCSGVGPMISINHDDLQKVIASVADWPVHDRIKLARKILETVEEPTMPAARGLKGEEVIDLLQIPQPAPDDNECERIVQEERLLKYKR